jgi:mono/diheme cytochrome c family protein
MDQKNKKIRQVLAGLVLITAIGGIVSCTKYQWAPVKIDPEVVIYYQNDIQPIFNSNCLSCHGATKAPDLRDGKSYAALTKGAYIDQPGETSKLYLKMIGPEHSPRSSGTDKQNVLNWINQGAKNN